MASLKHWASQDGEPVFGTLWTMMLGALNLMTKRVKENIE